MYENDYKILTQPRVQNTEGVILVQPQFAPILSGTRRRNIHDKIDNHSICDVKNMVKMLVKTCLDDRQSYGGGKTKSSLSLLWILLKFEFCITTFEE